MALNSSDAVGFWLCLQTSADLRAALSRSNLGGGAVLGWCGFNLCWWFVGVRARAQMIAGVVTQLDTHPHQTQQVGYEQRRVHTHPHLGLPRQ